MKQEINSVYDLTENCIDVWGEVNSELDSPPTEQDLAYIRRVVKAHYAWTAKRLAELREVRFDECATWALQMRAGREVTNFQTGDRYRIPDYFEVELNASPTMEALIQEGLTPPVPNVL